MVPVSEPAGGSDRAVLSGDGGAGADSFLGRSGALFVYFDSGRPVKSAGKVKVPNNCPSAVADIQN